MKKQNKLSGHEYHWLPPWVGQHWCSDSRVTLMGYPVEIDKDNLKLLFRSGCISNRTISKGELICDIDPAPMIGLQMTSTLELLMHYLLKQKPENRIRSAEECPKLEWQNKRKPDPRPEALKTLLLHNDYEKFEQMLNSSLELSEKKENYNIFRWVCLNKLLNRREQVLQEIVSICSKARPVLSIISEAARFNSFFFDNNQQINDLVSTVLRKLLPLVTQPDSNLNQILAKNCMKWHESGHYRISQSEMRIIIASMACYSGMGIDAVSLCLEAAIEGIDSENLLKLAYSWVKLTGNANKALIALEQRSRYCKYNLDFMIMWKELFNDEKRVRKYLYMYPTFYAHAARVHRIVLNSAKNTRNALLESTDYAIKKRDKWLLTYTGLLYRDLLGDIEEAKQCFKYRIDFSEKLDEILEAAIEIEKYCPESAIGKNTIDSILIKFPLKFADKLQCQQIACYLSKHKKKYQTICKKYLERYVELEDSFANLISFARKWSYRFSKETIKALEKAELVASELSQWVDLVQEMYKFAKLHERIKQILRLPQVENSGEKSATLYASIANQWLELGEDKECLDWLKKALYCPPECKAHVFVARTLANKFDIHHLAVESLLKAEQSAEKLNTHKEWSSVITSLKELCGDESAIACLKKAQSIIPKMGKNPENTYWLAYAYLWRNHFNMSEKADYCEKRARETRYLTRKTRYDGDRD